jgi:hypothetical protein
LKVFLSCLGHQDIVAPHSSERKNSLNRLFLDGEGGAFKKGQHSIIPVLLAVLYD